MSNPLDENLKVLFADARQAYQEGRERDSHLSAAASGVSFDAHLERSIGERLRIEEELLLRASSVTRRRALVEARRGHLFIARQALWESQSIAYSECLSEEARLIITSFNNAVEAYMQYKDSKFAAAIDLVYDALGRDYILVTRFGYGILILHRVQLAHNLMRIYLRQGRTQAAIELACGLLRYVEGDPRGWQVPASESAGDPAELPSDLCGAMFVQVVGELAILLARKSRRDAAAILAPLIPIAKANVELRSDAHSRARQWLRIKLNWTQGRHEDFLAAAIPFIYEGRGEVALLWKLLVEDMLECSLCFDSPQTYALQQAIYDDCQMMGYKLPEFLSGEVTRQSQA